MSAKIALRIADIIIQIESSFPLASPDNKEERLRDGKRLGNFLYPGTGKPDIKIRVEIVYKLPRLNHADLLFASCDSKGRRESWRLLKKGDIHIYKSQLRNKRQLGLVNKKFNRVTFNVSAKTNSLIWYLY